MSHHRSSNFSVTCDFSNLGHINVVSAYISEYLLKPGFGNTTESTLGFFHNDLFITSDTRTSAFADSARKPVVSMVEVEFL